MESALDYLQSHVPLVYAIVCFAFGAAVGSFLNVAICRLPYGLSLTHPPSSCPRCGQGIAGTDNLPILSWILLKGRCRRCREPISLRYPFVELLTAILFALTGYLFADDPGQPLERAFVLTVLLLYVAALVTVIFIDLDHQIIPDEISLGGLAAALVASAVAPLLHLRYVEAPWFPVSPHLEGLLRSGVGAIAGGGLVLAISMVGTVGFRKQIAKAREADPEIMSAIGLGDVKLMAMVGAMQGWEAVLLAFFFGTCAGAVVGAVVKLWTGNWPAKEEDTEQDLLSSLAHRWQTGESIIPFGPFLVFGSFLMLYLHGPVIDLFRVYILHQDLAPSVL